MATVAVLSEKGGVGKTSTVEGLAAAATRRRLNVLVVDMDPRHSLSDGMGIDNPAFTTADLLFEDGPDGRAVDAITAAWDGTVDVLAGERGLGNREADNATGLDYRLRSALTGVGDHYDLVLIDVPPRPGGVLVRAALLASSHVLLVTTLDSGGLEGVRDALGTVDTLRRHQHPNLADAGLLRTIVPPGREREAQRCDAELAEYLPTAVFASAIPRRAVHRAAHAAGAPLTAYSDGKKLVEAYDQALAELLTRVGWTSKARKQASKRAALGAATR